ncbi:MAG TPA: hypothetical protein VG166_15115 [Caulobacteraceae bacterium]|jgi:hypothetical protein|nr:hypothetical protein [Caulobacteraceae bacterium]
MAEGKDGHAAEVPPMEVHHHPHPMHGGSEFLREVGVVVIGVLLALGAGQIAEIFRRHARGEPLRLKGPVARPPHWTASAATWDIAVSGQALGHMTQAEKLGFSDAFNTFGSFSRHRDEEDADWRRLALLDHPDLLDANDWSRLHEAWGDALGIGDRLRSIMDDIQSAGALGEQPLPHKEDQQALRDAFCAPLID